MTSFDDQLSCSRCGIAESAGRLDRCSICRRLFCDSCAHRAAGRRFCSDRCGAAYLFEGGEEGEEE